MLLDGVDWEIVTVLAALVLIEGLRRIPAGGLVVRAVGWSGWKPAGPAEPRARWALVSWWPPLAPALVLPPLGGASPVSSEMLEARMRVAQRAASWLAAGGALTLATLVLGMPIATARLGGFGFICGIVVVLALALATAAAGWWTLRRMSAPGAPCGAPRAAPRGVVLAWCSPFASGRVLEGVYQAALAGASPAQALRALAGDAVFAEWARARAYDVVHGGHSDPDLSAAADGRTLSAIVASEPGLAEGAGSYCPRCAAVWVMTRETCPECGVAAVAVSVPQAK